MTSRSTTLMFIALVLLASMTVAATPVPNDVLRTSAAPDSCNSFVATLGASPLDPAKAASTYPACGSCSELACRGLSIYDFCGGTIRQPKRCRTAGLVCIEEPEKPKCVCVSWATP